MTKRGKRLAPAPKSDKRAVKPYIRSGPTPQGIRFDGVERSMIKDLQRATTPRLSVSEITKRAVRYAVPKFLTGELPFFVVTPEPAPANGTAKK